MSPNCEFSVFLPLWPWKLGQDNQNLTSSLCPNYVSMKIWKEIQPLVHKILCRQESVMPTPMPITSKGIKASSGRQEALIRLHRWEYSETCVREPPLRLTLNSGWCEKGSCLIKVLFVLRFYGPVNPMGSCRARSVYLTTRLLGRLSPLSG